MLKVGIKNYNWKKKRNKEQNMPKNIKEKRKKERKKYLRIK